MSAGVQRQGKSREDVGTGIIERLRACQTEVEAAILTRVAAVPGLPDARDTEYWAVAHAAVMALVDYSLTCLAQSQSDAAHDEEWQAPVPAAAIAQTRLAARNGVSLSTVVCCYIAGHRVLGEFLMDAADLCGPSGQAIALPHLHRTQEGLLECVTATIAEEYERAIEQLGRSSEQRRGEIVRKLLACEPVDTTELHYEISNAWHIGLIGAGAAAKSAVKSLAQRLGCQLLCVARGDQTMWAWLASSRTLATVDIEPLLPANGAVSLVVGEPGLGLAGWRQTHQEAQAALLVALRQPQRLTRCADVTLEAAMLHHEVLAKLLQETFLVPLGDPHEGGSVLRETLRAYFFSSHNVGAAAAMLQVDRGTVRKRLRTVEQRLGRFLNTCHAELEIALRLESLRGSHADTDPLAPGWTKQAGAR